MDQEKKQQKSSTTTSHACASCVRRYIYILSIKRNIYKSLEIIGVYSNMSKAKKIVQDNFNRYKEILSEARDSESKKILANINEWRYSNKKWENSKQDKRFYFYALSQDLHSYYQIIKLELDADEIKGASDMCNSHSHVCKKRKENLTSGNQEKEDTDKGSAVKESFVS